MANTYTSPNSIYQCLPTTEPKEIVSHATPNFGVPKGMPGRAGNQVRGILIHCLETELSAYDDTVCQDYKLTKAKPKHPSIHYAVGHNGQIHEYVCPDDMAWGFQPYTSNFVSTPTFPDPACPVNWSLFTANPGVNPDQYLIHVGLESGVSQAASTCEPCEITELKTETGYQRLVHLLAWLADRYNLNPTTDFIQFDQNVRLCAEDECKCADIQCLLCDVSGFCQTCDNPPLANFEPGQLVNLYGENASRCTTRQPIGAALAANLRIQGTQLQYFDGASWLPVPTV